MRRVSWWPPVGVAVLLVRVVAVGGAAGGGGRGLEGVALGEGLKKRERKKCCWVIGIYINNDLTNLKASNLQN